MDAQFSRQTHAVINFDRYESVLREVTDANEVPLFRRHDIMRHWAESGLFDLMTVDHDKLPLVASRLYDCIGRAVADFITRGAQPETGAPVPVPGAINEGSPLRRAGCVLLLARRGPAAAAPPALRCTAPDGVTRLRWRCPIPAVPFAVAKHWSSSPSAPPRPGYRRLRPGAYLSCPARRGTATPLAPPGRDRGQ